jgi:hypothetical protein
VATATDIFAVLAPEFENDSRVSTVVSLAKTQVGKVFGKQRSAAIANLAAHMLSMADRNGAAGGVASKSEGGLSISFAGLATDDLLAQTSYGAEFLRLRRMVIFGPRTRGTG